MIISESYLHFETAVPIEPRVVGEAVFPLVEQAASRYFAEFHEVRRAEVVIDEGSIKLKGIIRVTAAVLIGYGGIRSGIDYARHDGKAAAIWINSQVRDVLDVPITTIIARRSRTPGPTQLLRLFEKVQAGAMSPEEATHRARELLREFGESDQAIRQLVGRIDGEFHNTRERASADGRQSGTFSEPSPVSGRRPSRRRHEEPRPFVVPRRRLRFVRDPNGRIRILEEAGY